MSPKRKKKKNRPLLDLLFYYFVRCLAIFLQMIPIDASLHLARFLGRRLYDIYHRGRQRALDHLRQSYPHKSPAWLEHTARRSFEHLAMFAFDILHAGRLVRPSTWHRYIDFDENDPRIRQMLQIILRRQPALLITGHYGNFEILGCALTGLGLETFNIARPIDNPYINHYVYHVLHRGQTIIYKKGASSAMQDVLDNGNALGIVADQNGKRKDIFVDFFGRKAATYKSIGLMAMHYHAPIIIGYSRRLHDRFRFKIGVTRIIYPREWQNQPDPLRWITQAYTSAIETFVRTDPEQYWWVHRRWKTRPPEERQSSPPKPS